MKNLIDFMNGIASNGDSLEGIIESYYEVLKPLYYIVSGFSNFKIDRVEIDEDSLTIYFLFPSWATVKKALEQFYKEDETINASSLVTDKKNFLVCKLNKKEG